MRTCRTVKHRSCYTYFSLRAPMMTPPTCFCNRMYWMATIAMETCWFGVESRLAISLRVRSSCCNSSQPPNSSMISRYLTRLRFGKSWRANHQKFKSCMDLNYKPNSPSLPHLLLRSCYFLHTAIHTSTCVTLYNSQTSFEGLLAPSQASVKKPPASTP